MICVTRRRPRQRFGGKAAVYQDYRKLLDHKGIDVVTNATPDHWHTAITIAACKAGKDVYAEKPMTFTIDEGKLLCKVVEETGRIVQIGTMQRSMKEFQTAVELVRNGRIGKLKQVWVALPYYSTKGGPVRQAAGSARTRLGHVSRPGAAARLLPAADRRQFPLVVRVRRRDHHRLGQPPRRYRPLGHGLRPDGPDVGRGPRPCFRIPKGPQYYNTPDRFFSRMMYPNGVEVLYFSSINERLRFGDVAEHEVTSPEQIEWLFGKDVPKEIKSYNRNGIMFIGEKGKVFVNRGAVHGKAVEELKQNPLPADAWRAYPSLDHMANFFDCVKTRKQPCTPVQVEHRSVTACHLTNISIRLKRKFTWDPVAAADRRRRRGQRLAETQAAAAVSGSRLARQR